MKIENISFNHYINMLNQGVYYTFVRYGDGEWNAIRSIKKTLKKPCNCDKHQYFKGLGIKLKETLQKPIRDNQYFYGFQTLTDLTQRSDVISFCDENMTGIQLHNADIFHIKNEAGELLPLIEALRKKHVCIVGPKWLRDLGQRYVFSPMGFIEIPEINCYLQAEQIKRKILEYAKWSSEKDVVYAFSASMATECMIYDLWPMLGKQNWLIDFGSLWDVYAGKYTRKYHSRISKETINKNINR
ncbi:MAG: hypothetical protein KJ556_21925 [Gammaproteobacteria bacterium]|nr:hypothetical protein [Gammaproteobacteria bacterium]